MKNSWKQALFAIFMGLVVPWCVVMLATPDAPQEEITTQTTAQVQETAPSTDVLINVLLDGEMKEMRLDDYLVGVLLGELPGDFHLEAKMAQAVVARTYTMRTVRRKDKHPNDAVCSDSSCCQSYIAPGDYLARGGSVETVDSAMQAVGQTEGMVLTYAGELIDATYFSCSGGTTETALAVWGSDVPYLQSVSSPGEEMAAHYTDTVKFTAKEFQVLLGVELNGDPATWFGNIVYTDGEGVASMTVGGKEYSGTELRSVLGLRSTAFTITAVGNSIVITTKGFGHRVGMSQYGAQAMALAGSDYEQILLHYYSGAVLEQMQ